MGQESRHDFAGSSVSWSLLRLQSKCQPELGSPLKAQLGKALHGSKHMGLLEGSTVSMACWTESLASLVYVGKKMPSVPCHLGLPHIATCFIKMCKSSRQEGSCNHT